MAGLLKARLIELETDFKTEKSGGQDVTVQFNPDTLKVTFANQLVQPQGGDQKAGNGGLQFVGAGSTKLALTLWFDVTAMTEDAVDDVRRLTQKVIFFMTPADSDSDPQKKVPPATRFIWGSFIFDGIVEGLEENLEFFSPDGKPLRASIALTLSQQKILRTNFDDDGGRVPSRPGQSPLATAKAGSTLQGLLDSISQGGGWQAIAAKNGIEDPLRLPPGQLIDTAGSIGRAGLR